MLYDTGSTVTDYTVQGSNFAYCLGTTVSDPSVGCIYNLDRAQFPASVAALLFPNANPLYVDNGAISLLGISLRFHTDHINCSARADPGVLRVVWSLSGGQLRAGHHHPEEQVRVSCGRRCDSPDTGTR